MGLNVIIDKSQVEVLMNSKKLTPHQQNNISQEKYIRERKEKNELDQGKSWYRPELRDVPDITSHSLKQIK